MGTKSKYLGGGVGRCGPNPSWQVLVWSRRVPLLGSKVGVVWGGVGVGVTPRKA